MADEEGSQSSTGCLDTDTLVAQWVKPLFGAPLATGSGRVLGIRRSQFHRFDIWWTAGMDNRWSSLLHPLPTSGPAHMTLGTRGARLALVMDGCQALGAKGQGSNSARFPTIACPPRQQQLSGINPCGSTGIWKKGENISELVHVIVMSDCGSPCGSCRRWDLYKMAELQLTSELTKVTITTDGGNHVYKRWSGLAS
ncbi:hypothetical protein Bbelb_405340, partial [Branchiostoma belcheri]